MPEKIHHGSSSASSFATAVFIGAIVNAFFSVAGLIICMPCMLSDALGGYAFVYTYKKTSGGRAALNKRQAALFGAFAGLLGCAFFVFILFVVYLAFGNLDQITSGPEKFLNSLSGHMNFPWWAVLAIGFMVAAYKVVISAIATSLLSSLE